MRNSWLGFAVAIGLIGGAQAQSPTINSFSVSPSTISFTLNNPGGVVTASSPVAVTANVASPKKSLNWNATVQAGSATLSGAGCPTNIPVTDITATCSGATATGKGSSNICTSALLLSTSPQVFMSGTEGTGGVSNTYSGTLTFTLPDKWAYIATPGATCTVQLSYTVTFF